MSEYQNVCIGKSPAAAAFNEMETNNYQIPVGAIVLSAAAGSAGIDANSADFSHLRSADSSLTLSNTPGSNQVYPTYQLPYSTQLGQNSAPQHPNPHQLPPPPPQVHVIDMSGGGPTSFHDAYQIHSSIFRR